MDRPKESSGKNQKPESMSSQTGRSSGTNYTEDRSGQYGMDFDKSESQAAQTGNETGQTSSSDNPEPGKPGPAYKEEAEQVVANPDLPEDRESLEIDLTRPREIPSLFGKGFVMGSADVVPGVSGGTMALILGIYSRLIFAIRSVDMDVIRWVFTMKWARVFNHVHWMFLISVLSGGVSAVFFFTKVVALPVLMHTHPEIIYGLFFGLIAGSILLLLRAIQDIGWKEGLVVLLGLMIGFRIVTLVPTDTPETGMFVFMSGSLAVTAMVLPGISGSFILLILGKYDYILGNIALLGTDRTLDAVLVLIPFGLGMVVGLVVFVRLLSWLLKRFHILTLCLLVGFMAGSLYVIWPFQEREYTEIVTERVLPVDDPELQELMEEEPDRRRPEYSEPGPVINPEAPESVQMREVRHVRRRLTSSRPYWPQWGSPGEDHRLQQGGISLYGGLATMITGFLLVGYLSRLMKRKGL